MRRREHRGVHRGRGVHHFGIAGTAALATGLALHVRPVPPACCVRWKHFVDHKVGEAVAAPAHKHVCAQTSVGQRTPPTCSLGGSPFQQRPRKRVFVCRLVQASLGELTHERADGGLDRATHLVLTLALAREALEPVTCRQRTKQRCDQHEQRRA